MAKFIINGNKVFMRHWFTWYMIIGKTATRIKFKKGKNYDKE